MNDLTLQLITGAVIGFGAGYLGAFMILRRMALVGDALSHVALPGIAVAILFGIDPFAGAFGALFLAILGIWYLERKTALPSETLVGIFFTISLAAGLLLMPEPELLEALFGDISKIGPLHTVLSVILVFVVCLFMHLISKNVVLGVISKDLAKAMRIPINRINLVFLLMVATVVALGLKVAGTLLMGSLVIIPAAAAQNISSSLSRYTLYAACFGALSSFFGILLARQFGSAPGPIVVLVSGIIFLVTVVYKRTV